MSRIERVRAALAGAAVDLPPRGYKMQRPALPACQCNP